jgi:hypothetical protein
LTSSTRRKVSSEHVDAAEAVERGADIVGDLVLAGHIGRDRNGTGRRRQVLDRGLQFPLLAVDCDNMRTALGQQLHGSGADDAGGAGDDGNPAIETNAIGHAWRFLGVSLAGPVIPDLRGPARGARAFMAGLFHVSQGLTSSRATPQPALSPPYSAC